MNKELTERQADIIDYVKDYKDNYGYSPTYTEIADYFGFSSRNAQQHIRAIERKGKIKTTPGISRSIIIID